MQRCHRLHCRVFFCPSRHRSQLLPELSAHTITRRTRECTCVPTRPGRRRYGGQAHPRLHQPACFPPRALSFLPPGTLSRLGNTSLDSRVTTSHPPVPSFLARPGLLFFSRAPRVSPNLNAAATGWRASHGGAQVQLVPGIHPEDAPPPGHFVVKGSGQGHADLHGDEQLPAQALAGVRACLRARDGVRVRPAAASGRRVVFAEPALAFN